MLEALNNLDHTLMLQLNYDGGALLDAFWYAVSYKFSWIPLYVAILIAFIRLDRLQAFPSKSALRRGGFLLAVLFLRPRGHLLLLILITVLIILAADQLSSGLIKPLVERPRPSHEPGIMEQLHYVNDYHGGRFGFVSSHAANTAALALWISLLFRQRALWCAMCSFFVINSYSRIYLGVHYPGDILCGTLVGIGCALLGFALYKRFSASCASAECASASCASAERASTSCASAERASASCKSAPHSPALSRPITLTLWASILVMLIFAAA